MEKIDNLDRQILEIIMRNARIPSKDVAAECGVSRAAIHQRIQRMIDMHVITGSGYHVNPKSLGFRTCTYIGGEIGERFDVSRCRSRARKDSRSSRMPFYDGSLHNAL